MLIYTVVPTKARKKAKKVTKQRKPAKKFVAMKPTPPQVYRAQGTEHIPSHDLSKVPPKREELIWYEGEMAEREIAAQEEMELRAEKVRNAFRQGKVAACYISG